MRKVSACRPSKDSSTDRQSVCAADGEILVAAQVEEYDMAAGFAEVDVSPNEVGLHGEVRVGFQWGISWVHLKLRLQAACCCCFEARSPL